MPLQPNWLERMLFFTLWWGENVSGGDEAR